MLSPTADGLFCEAGAFHVDPWGAVPRAVITHAHGDHARFGSRAYLCAEPCAPLLRRRFGPEATIVVRELDGSAKKGRLAESIDRLMVKLGWNRGGGVHAWPIGEMRALLEAEGFSVEVADAGRGAFKGNAILVAKR